MVKTELVEEAKKGGREFLSKLDKKGLEIRAAFWHLDFDTEEWTLVLASPLVDRSGEREMYLRMHPIWLASQDVDWTKLSAVRTDDKLVKLLDSVAHTGPGIHGKTHDRWVINGEFVGEAYIYRMNL
jgi:hypothetical protein